MRIDYSHFKTIESDLGLNAPFVKGQRITIRKCWHFSTDGNAIDVLFYDENDFRDGMNRIYIVSRKYRILILAFVLMDTHVHFVLYGEYDECNRFMHDYMARTSRHISVRHGDTKKLHGVPIDFQVVDNERYLKTVICYVVKNPPVAGIPHMSWNYPWSSGSLYFKKGICWSMVPEAMVCTGKSTESISSAGMDIDTAGYSDRRHNQLTAREWRDTMKTKASQESEVLVIDGIIHPEEYVAVELVEKIFRTTKSYHFFLCHSKEDDVESRGGSISHLSIPMQEMRQHKTEQCIAMFGTKTIKGLSSGQRLSLARALHRKYNSSIKQIARLCGLVYSEVKDMI